jgi:curved DNA-binding protein CbpA
MTDDKYYTILGLERGATPAEIKQSYRRLVLRYHPDKNPGDEVAATKFRAVHNAYKALTDGSNAGVPGNPGLTALYCHEAQHQGKTGHIYLTDTLVGFTFRNKKGNWKGRKIPTVLVKAVVILGPILKLKVERVVKDQKRHLEYEFRLATPARYASFLFRWFSRYTAQLLALSDSFV